MKAKAASRTGALLLVGAALVAASVGACSDHVTWPNADTYLVSKNGGGIDLFAITSRDQVVARVAAVPTTHDVAGAVVLPWKSNHWILWLVPSDSADAEIVDVDGDAHRLTVLGTLEGEGTPVVVGDNLLTVDQASFAGAASGAVIRKRSLPDLRQLGTLAVPMAPISGVSSGNMAIVYYVAQDRSNATNKPSPEPSEPAASGSPDPNAPAPRQPIVPRALSGATLVSLDSESGRVAIAPIPGYGSLAPGPSSVAVVTGNSWVVADRSMTVQNHDLVPTGQAGAFVGDRLFVATTSATGGSSIADVTTGGVVTRLPGTDTVRSLRASGSDLIALRSRDVCFVVPSEDAVCRAFAGDNISQWP